MHNLRKLATATLLLGALSLAACSDQELTTTSQAPNAPTPAFTVNIITNPATVNGALWTPRYDAGKSVGTGVIRPFLDMQASPNEDGLNTDNDAFLYDQHRTTYTNKLPLNYVPIIDVDPLGYAREFVMDANESNSAPDPQFSIDTFDLYLCDDTSAPMYDALTDVTANPKCALVYNLGADAPLLAADSTKGSGNVFDYRILIPETKFEDAADVLGTDLCPYLPTEAAETACGQYLVLWTRLGFEGGNYITDATFEEFSTILRGYVEVTKTAVPEFTRTYTWDIDKTVDDDSHTMFPGQTGTSNYDVIIDQTVVDAGFAVTGTVTITNPSGEDVVIESILDELNGTPITLACTPAYTPGMTLADGASIVCTYDELVDGDPGTNEVFVQLEDAGLSGASADYTFVGVAPTVVGYPTAHVTDTYEGALGTASGDITFEYAREFTCNEDEGEWPNTATITETGQNDSELVTVTCVDLGITKDAETTVTRTWEWDIDKSVVPATWNLFMGDEGTSEYTVAVDKVGYDDDDWAIEGTITITNNTALVAAITNVTDLYEGNPMTVDCGVSFPYNLAAGGTLECDYEGIDADGSGGNNIATVHMAGGSWDSDPLPIDFDEPDHINEVYASVNVTDTNGAAWGPVSDDTSWKYQRTFECNDDEGTHENTAEITETGQQDDASVTVNCYALTVEKTANEELTRTWTWSLNKAVDEDGFAAGTYDAATHTATIQEGELLTVYFDITGSAVPVDSDWKVSGNITIDNPAPMAATLTAVTDVVSPAINATVDCPALTVPAAGSLVCTYEADLPDATGRTNTATATLQNHAYDPELVATLNGTTDFTGSVAVDFTGAVVNKVDECIDLVDALSGNPGVISPAQFCEDDTPPLEASVSFDFGGELGIPVECEANDFVNLVTGTTIDTETVVEATAPVTIYVGCEEGCTLTPGYWMTHTQSHRDAHNGKGPPIDERWAYIGDADGDGNVELEKERFFLSTQTFYQVMAAAPKGNVYYNLSGHFVAAWLNSQSATMPAAVLAAFNGARTMFMTYTPAEMAGWKGNNPLRQQALGYASLLAQYNEGILGPGHCTENDLSR